VPVRGLIWLAFYLTSLPFCFVNPFYGLVMWTIIAFMNPQWYTWSAGEWLPWAFLVAIPTVLGSVMFVRAWNRLLSREVFLTAILWGWFTITSFIASHTPGFAHYSGFTWFQWNNVSKILFMAAMILPIVDGFQRLRLLVMTIAGCFGFYLLRALPFIIITGGSYRLYGPPLSMIADNNDLGLALNMTLPLFYFLAQTETGWYRRLAWLFFLIDIPAVFFTYSRGALVGLVTVMFLIFMRVRLQQRILMIPVVVLGLLVALLFAPQEWRNRMDPTRQGALDGSAQARLVAWEFARKVAADYPVTGGGFGVFDHELFERYGYRSESVHGPHSVYFQVLAEHGYIGIILYLALVASCFVSGRYAAVIGKATQNQTLIHYANMLRFSLVAFLSSGAFLGRAYFDYYFSLVMCMAVLKKVADEALAEAAEEEDSEEIEAGGTELLPEGELA
jgi:probable O-glycosylation ligase (exosortase A-associated)